MIIVHNYCEKTMQLMHKSHPIKTDREFGPVTATYIPAIYYLNL